MASKIFLVLGIDRAEGEETGFLVRCDESEDPLERAKRGRHDFEPLAARIVNPRELQRVLQPDARARR